MCCRPGFLLAPPIGTRHISNDGICHEDRFAAWAESGLVAGGIENESAL